MKIPFHNETDKFVHIGATTIPPFDTRDVEAILHPDYKAPKAEEPEPENPLAELLKASVKDIQPKLAELDMEQLTALEALEQESQKPRASLIEAVAAAKLDLAGKDD